MGRYKPKVSVRRDPDPTIERRLDQELEQTFPASDAPQITRDRPAVPKDRHRRGKSEPEAAR